MFKFLEPKSLFCQLKEQFTYIKISFKKMFSISTKQDKVY